MIVIDWINKKLVRTGSTSAASNFRPCLTLWSVQSKWCREAGTWRAVATPTKRHKASILCGNRNEKDSCYSNRCRYFRIDYWSPNGVFHLGFGRYSDSVFVSREIKKNSQIFWTLTFRSMWPMATVSQTVTPFFGGQKLCFTVVSQRNFCASNRTPIQLCPADPLESCDNLLRVQKKIQTWKYANFRTVRKPLWTFQTYQNGGFFDSLSRCRFYCGCGLAGDLIPGETSFMLLCVNVFPNRRAGYHWNAWKFNLIFEIQRIMKCKKKANWQRVVLRVQKKGGKLQKKRTWRTTFLRVSVEYKKNAWNSKMGCRFC